QEAHPQGRSDQGRAAPRLRALAHPRRDSSRRRRAAARVASTAAASFPVSRAMRVLFYGTPEFALPTLRALIAHHQVVAVVTQPDRPAGRGQQLMASPVKRCAEDAGIAVVQPGRLRDSGWPEHLARFDAEVAVVAAFGQILPKAILDVPARGSINVHAS